MRDGGILVVIVVLVFLMNMRAAAITLMAIPLSLVSAVLTMNYFGFTINTMSLGGLAIATGELVDDAIIDVENVVRRLARKRDKSRDGAAERRSKWSIGASAEIRGSVVFATLIVVLVFLPLFFLSAAWRGGCCGRWALLTLSRSSPRS